MSIMINISFEIFFKYTFYTFSVMNLIIQAWGIAKIYTTWQIISLRVLLSFFYQEETLLSVTLFIRRHVYSIVNLLQLALSFG